MQCVRERLCPYAEKDNSFTPGSNAFFVGEVIMIKNSWLFWFFYRVNSLYRWSCCCYLAVVSEDLSTSNTVCVVEVLKENRVMFCIFRAKTHLKYGIVLFLLGLKRKTRVFRSCLNCSEPLVQHKS